jgi:5-methylthioribose kinase
MKALPVIESSGKKQPLTIDRSYFEYQALLIHGKATSSLSSCRVPKVLCFVKEMGLLVMEYIHPPNLQLRRALIQNLRYPSMAQDIGQYCANTLFKTSTFSLTGRQLRKNVESWSKNSEVCAWVEQVVFTEPYTKVSLNNLNFISG